MAKLILHPTDISQWHALVNEAQASTHLILNESTESYLVFLLMRFSQTTKLVESIIAVDFLDAMHLSGKQHIELLRDVGDKSLLLCGLFPGVAAKRHVQVDYFSGMGRSAYLTVSELYSREFSGFYAQFNEQFITMQHILEAMRCENIPFQGGTHAEKTGEDFLLN